MSAPTWPEVLTTLVSGGDLAPAQTRWAMEQILSGEASSAQIAGFAIGLRSKGECVEELDAAVETLYAFAAPLTIEGRALDVVGTGGDRSFSVNISTMSAIVAAGAGALVVKHGNRSASSKSGSADVLEELGVRLDLAPADVARVAHEVGITFCFAPTFHGALRYPGPTRSELGVPTIFNLLGPIANPARPAAQAIGCADLRSAPLIAGVFAERGVDAWVFRGDDGLDELTTTTTSTLWVVEGNGVEERILEPLDLGIPRATAADLRGGDVSHNARVVRDLLGGAQGPVRDAVLLNAGAALAVYEGENGSLEERVAAGMARAAEAIDSGAAATLLERWAAATGR